MIERVAKAISGAPFPSARSLAAARRAIEAMRMPTEAWYEALEEIAEARWTGDDAVERIQRFAKRAMKRMHEEDGTIPYNSVDFRSGPLLPSCDED